MSRARIVRFEACQLTWLDGCTTSKPAAYGTKERLPRAPNATTTDIADEIDLFEQLHARSAAFTMPVRRGSSLHIEELAVTARRLDRPLGRDDLDPGDACAHATHAVTVIEYGALRLNVDAPPGSAEPYLDAQKSLELGSYAACRREDDGACEAPVAVTLEPFIEKR